MAAGPGRLVKIEGKMNAATFCEILEDIMTQYARELQPRRGAVHARFRSKLTELVIFCHQEWTEIAVSRRASLIETSPHRLSAVIAAKGACTNWLVPVLCSMTMKLNQI